MASFTVRRRESAQKWWMEPNEVSDGTHLDEAYDPSRLKPGFDGKNGPDVKKMYADGSVGSLGAGKKTSKGSADPKGLSTKTEKAKRVNEEFEDDDLSDPMLDDDMGDMDGMDDMDVNPEADLPPEMDAIDGGTDVASDIRITIGGQEYILVPATEDEGMGMDDELPMEDDGMGMDDSIEAEPDDVSQPKFEAKRTAKPKVKESINYDKVLDKALKAKKEKDLKIKQALAMLEKSKADLKELFTGDYVQNKNGQALSGLDFSDVRGDTEFAVIARAATGKQYTPSASDGEQEPTTKKEAFKKWLADQMLKIKENDSDPGQDAEDFNDVTLDNSLEGGLETFPEIPEVVGADPDVLSSYAKTEEARKARRVKESEQPVQFPSKEVKADIEKSLDESFDYKAFLAGKYK
jgi:hypothetical protein